MDAAGSHEATYDGRGWPFRHVVELPWGVGGMNPRLAANSRWTCRIGGGPPVVPPRPCIDMSPPPYTARAGARRPCEGRSTRKITLTNIACKPSDSADLIDHRDATHHAARSARTVTVRGARRTRRASSTPLCASGAPKRRRSGSPTPRAPRCSRARARRGSTRLRACRSRAATGARPTRRSRPCSSTRSTSARTPSTWR